MSDIKRAESPEDLTRLFVELANAKDAQGMADLYEDDAVVAYPPGGVTRGHDAILELWVRLLENSPSLQAEEPLPTLVSGEIALTATIAKDGAGVRAQVARRQADGSWLRVLDRPEFFAPRG